MSDDKAKESLNAWASYFRLLDGPEGKGGGLIVRAANRWMALCAWEARCYAIARWLRHDSIDPATIGDAQLRTKYTEFVAGAQKVLSRVETLNKAIGKTTAGSTPMSWDTDPGYWACGVAIAGSAAAMASGDFFDGIGLGLAAYELCGDYLDGLDDGGRGDDDRGDRGGTHP